MVNKRRLNERGSCRVNCCVKPITQLPTISVGKYVTLVYFLIKAKTVEGLEGNLWHYVDIVVSFWIYNKIFVSKFEFS